MSGEKTDLGFLLGDLDTHIFAHDETGDSLVASRRVHIGKYLHHQEELCVDIKIARTKKVSASAEFEIQLVDENDSLFEGDGIHLRLGAVQDVVAVRVFLSRRLQRKRIGAL